MIRLFCGYDSRETIGFHVFSESVIRRCADEVVQIAGISGKQRDGTNAFTYARFLVPYLCNFRGTAIWADGSDMLLIGDLNEIVLTHIKGHDKAVHVVKHQYRTKHSRKYIGTAMEADNADYPRKNWSSLIVWDCGHPANSVLTQDFVARMPGYVLHRFNWLPDELIGELPAEWNVLVGEQPLPENPKLLHYTLGIPAFEHYRNCDGAEAWHEIAQALR